MHPLAPSVAASLGGQPPPNAPLAVWALVLGISSLMCCALTAIPAWIVGNKALQQIAESNGTLGGEGMAKAGKVIGIVVLVLTALWLLGSVCVGIFSGISEMH
jgi:hypothetical protein